MGDTQKYDVMTMEGKLYTIKWLDSGVMAKIIASELGVKKITVGDKDKSSKNWKWCAA